jgi:hypothetical protein
MLVEKHGISEARRRLSDGDAVPIVDEQRQFPRKGHCTAECHGMLFQTEAQQA